jgi:uncharacterized protein (TIGR02646 family)
LKRLERPRLAKRAKDYLARKQKEINKGKNRNIDRAWKYARQTVTMQSVFNVLVSMVGTRARCMFCHDSRGTTIEHFYPKAVYRKKVFVWKNFLLLCQGCQNHKGDRFELDATGLPLLIDPTAEDPWKYLFFDGKTGFITAKFDTAGNEDPKGKHTTDPKVLPLNIEAITMGRQRTRRNLIRAVRTFTNQITAGNSLTTARDEMIQAVLDNDDYGLAIWYFFKEGSSEEPFKSLRTNCNAVWLNVQKSIMQASN